MSRNVPTNVWPHGYDIDITDIKRSHNLLETVEKITQLNLYKFIKSYQKIIKEFKKDVYRIQDYLNNFIEFENYKYEIKESFEILENKMKYEDIPLEFLKKDILKIFKQMKDIYEKIKFKSFLNDMGDPTVIDRDEDFNKLITILNRQFKNILKTLEDKNKFEDFKKLFLKVIDRELDVFITDYDAPKKIKNTVELFNVKIIKKLNLFKQRLDRTVLLFYLKPMNDFNKHLNEFMEDLPKKREEMKTTGNNLILMTEYNFKILHKFKFYNTAVNIINEIKIDFYDVFKPFDVLEINNLNYIEEKIKHLDLMEKNIKNLYIKNYNQRFK